MSKTLSVIILILLTALLNSCASVTPGDAAYKAGHFEQAADLYRRGAEQGDKLAAFKLGELYNFDLKDNKKAVVWYKRAYELGHVPAAWFIGKIYESGEGDIERNYLEAEKWFRKGAEKGQHYAMYDLAGLYAKQVIQPSDDIQGLMWLEAVTILAGNFKPQNEGTKFILNDPKEYRKTFQNRMKKSDISKAQEMALSWVSKWENKN